MDAVVDFVEFGGLVVKELEGLDGNGEAEAFGTGFVDALEDSCVGFVAHPVGDLVDFGVGEGGEGALFSHGS